VLIWRSIAYTKILVKSCLKERTHTGDQCPKSLNPAGDMKKHRRSHSGEKPFHCDQCTNSFSEGGSLKKHWRTHTVEKPFLCKGLFKYPAIIFQPLPDPHPIPPWSTWGIIFWGTMGYVRGTLRYGYIGVFQGNRPSMTDYMWTSTRFVGFSCIQCTEGF